MSKLKLSEFDLYGTFRLTKAETAGVEDLVQQLADDTYLSRNARYYPESPSSQFFEICDEYQRLNEMLPMDGKPAFVVCEKMHELAIRAVNSIQRKRKSHLFQDGKHFDTVAQRCAQECADNLVRLINHQTATKTATNLREETALKYNEQLTYCIPFADNKKQLYLCANALPDDTEHLITPGRGSSKLGTLVQAVRKHQGLKPLGFTQIYYSLYGYHQVGKVFPQPLTNLPEKLLVMDDIIWQGHTLSRVKKALVQQGHQVTNGAVTAAFYSDARDRNCESIFQKDAWASQIDIIPNQYAQPSSDQMDLYNYLKFDFDCINDIINKPRNGADYHTADYHAMRDAERFANELGADLYTVSEKISPTAVAYNEKIRDQVLGYDTEKLRDIAQAYLAAKEREQ